jgi:aerobic carbon-monoxide dehydrogenase large subunit
MGGTARYVGMPVRRREDRRLLTGTGRYVDDVALPGTLHVALLRSPHASAEIQGIDVARARAAPGVVAVVTGTDTEHLGDLPVNLVVPGIRVPPHRPLAQGTVRAAGEPVAAVVGLDRYCTRDAVDLITVDYALRAAVVNVEAALAPGAPRVHEESPDNVAYTFAREGGDVERAFARADRIVSLRIAHSRIAPVAIEARGVLASPDPAGDELTVWTSTQMPFGVRAALAAAMKMPEHQIRVIAPEVGGGFGSKACPYREELLVAFLARHLGRPVKWISTRSEDLLTSMHAREEVDLVEAAVERDGRIAGLKVKTLCNLGAYLQLNTPLPPIRTVLFATGAYDIKNVRAEVVAVFTNTCPTGPYRGAGRPEAAFVAERLIDTVSREVGVDPVEIRRRNFIRPDQFPYRTATGQVYDSGDYARALDKALDVASYRQLRAQQADERQRGSLLGIGLSTYIELTGVMGWESGVVRIEPGGVVTALTGSSPHGQGHETTWAQIVADRLEVPIESVRVLHGDTALTPPGIGTFGSRSTVLAGSALAVAADRVKEKVMQVAARLLEASSGDVSYGDGRVEIRGAPGRGVTLAAVARAAYGPQPPPGIEPGLVATVHFRLPSEPFSFGAYVAVVRVERETGRVTLERLIAVDDCGTVVNPLLVEGQIHGGLAQGIGQALLERIAYDEAGQLVTGTLMDYALPRAGHLPVFTVERTETPSPLTPTGAKGVGEAGCIGAPPAIVNAVVDALAPFGVRHIDMPLTAERIWKTLRRPAGQTP